MAIPSIPNPDIWKAQLGTGDKSAWEMVYEVCYHPTIKLLRSSRFNCPPETAHDLFQEAVMVLHKYLTQPGYEVHKKVEDFIKGVAVNKWIDMFQKTTKQHKPEQFLFDEKVIVEEQMPSVELFEVDEHCQKLMLKHFETLGEIDQDILKAKYVEKFSMDKIADLLGLPVPPEQEQRRAAAQQRFNALEKDDPLALRILKKGPFSTDEIANLLKLPVSPEQEQRRNTARQRVFQATKRLKTKVMGDVESKICTQC